MNTPYSASTLQKVLAFGLAVSVVVWTFGILLVIPAQAVDAHSNGALVLTGSTVFKIMDGQRMGFPTANIFLSHGYSWNQIVPANSADLALAQGPNVQFADGTLVNDNGTVYMVSQGQKRGFTSASVFTGLGYNFAHALTGDLSAMTQGANVDSVTAAHPAGTLVNSNGTIWQVTSTGRRGIPSLGVFQSWGFDFAKVVPANAADVALAAEANLGYRVGSVVNDSGTVWAITSETGKQGFPSASCFLDAGYSWSALVVGSTSGYTAGANLCADGGTPTPPVSSGTLTVSLASDTPAAGVAIKSAARVPFTKVNLTATGGDVVIDSWVVERTGVAQDSTFASLDIIDLSTNAAINDSGKTLSSAHTASFTEDLTIKNGTTKSVMLAGNMAASPGAGETPKLALNSVTLKGGSVVGSFPVVGNAMTVNTSITIGTATVQRGAYTNATNTALEVGKQDYTFFSFQVQAGSAEDITFSQIKVYQQGSASLTSDLSDFKLLRDGTVLASSPSISGNYMSFSFPSQLITKGQTVQFQVQADVTSGSARTIDLGIWRTTDLLVTGQTYGANITPTYSGTGASGSNPVLSDNTFTISTGSLRVGRSSTVGAENITIGSNQVLGAFEFEAKGEPVVITALTLTTASSTTNGQRLEAVKLVDANGNVVAGPVDVALDLTAAWSDTFTVPVGVNHYKVVGTIPTSGGWASNDTITVSLNTPASATTAKGDVTGQTLTATPASQITASTQTVKTASLTVTKNSTPTNKSIITNSTSVLSGSWTFDATNSGEDIRITTIAVRASSTGKLNSLTLKADGTALSPVNDAPTSGADATSTFALSEPLIITKGTSKVINLYVNVGSNSNAGEVSAFGLTDTTSATNASVVAYGVTTGNRATVTLTAHNGALLTIAAAGTLTVNLDASAPASRLVVHGTNGVVLSEVRLKATNEAVDITKLTVNVVDGGLDGTDAGTFSQVEKVYLKKDGTIVGTTTGYSLGAAITTINLTKGVLQIPEGNTGVKFSLVGDIVDIGTNQPGTANADIKVGLGAYGNTTTGWTATGAGSNSAATITYTDSTGSAIVLHKSVPSVVTKSPGTSLTPSATLHRSEISAVGDAVGVYKLSYVLTTSSGITVSNAFTKLISCTGCGGITDGSQLTATANTTYVVNGVETLALPVDSSQSHGKRYVGISAGSTAVIDLMATVTGFSTNSDSVSTSLLGDTASTTMATSFAGGAVAGAFNTNNQGNFVWSDLSDDSSQAASALTATQWYNGYLVAGLGGTATSTAITISD